MELKSCWLVLIAIVCQSALSAADSSSASSRKEQEEYLRRYAYMGELSPDPRLQELKNDDERFRMAVMKFQMMTGLSATGTVDDETRKMMEMPRCGIPDEVGMAMVTRKRRKRYAVQGSMWPRTSLTYRINSYTSDLPKDQVDSEIKAAFKQWSDVSPLTFTETKSSSSSVDIDISFASRDHGDGSSFDGPGHVLAHAFFPRYGGDAHFDDDETWTSQSKSGTNLLQVAIHEFGHSLGLGHSDVKESIMAPVYRGYVPNIRLHSDDIAGIRNIYGGVKLTDSSTTLAPPPISICKDSTVDAFLAAENELYLFKGSHYYVMDFRGLRPEYPKLIKSDWSGLPDNIDTAFYSGGSIYFFKGDQVWSYKLKDRSLEAGYPQKIYSRFRGLPSDLDAAFIWNTNGKLYFIKGDKYYRVSNVSQNTGVDPSYPFPISFWKGLPGKIDAVFSGSNGKTHFFSGNNFYQYDDTMFKVDSGYPRSTNTTWLNCQCDSRPDKMDRQEMRDDDQPSTSSSFQLHVFHSSFTLLGASSLVLLTISSV